MDRSRAMQRRSRQLRLRTPRKLRRYAQRLMPDECLGRHLARTHRRAAQPSGAVLSSEARIRDSRPSVMTSPSFVASRALATTDSSECRLSIRAGRRSLYRGSPRSSEEQDMPAAARRASGLVPTLHLGPLRDRYVISWRKRPVSALKQSPPQIVRHRLRGLPADMRSRCGRASIQEPEIVSCHQTAYPLHRCAGLLRVQVHEVTWCRPFVPAGGLAGRKGRAPGQPEPVPADRWFRTLQAVIPAVASSCPDRGMASE